MGVPELVQVCREHANFCSSIGGISHDSPSGSPDERIMSVVSDCGVCTENLAINPEI